jgi:hypothetical protein
MKMRKMIGVMLLLAVLASFGWRAAQAQDANQLFVPETGHWVMGEFLTKYRSVPDPVLLFGYPITDAYQDRLSGLVVQYFQKARFELHPDTASELRVQLSPLGEYIYDSSDPLVLPSNFPTCRQFAETGFQVCYAFLDFFDANGGVAQFGYPISNFELQDERIVQYFQRTRFEWHPERPSGQRVALGELGSEYFTVRGEDPSRLLPNLSDNVLQTILNLRVRAFTQTAVTGLKGSQTVFVVVRDQNLLPVSNAQVALNVKLPSGEESHYVAQAPTDANGIARISFPFEAKKHGMAVVKVMVLYESLSAETVTSYRIWW